MVIQLLPLGGLRPEQGAAGINGDILEPAALKRRHDIQIQRFADGAGLLGDVYKRQVMYNGRKSGEGNRADANETLLGEMMFADSREDQHEEE